MAAPPAAAKAAEVPVYIALRRMKVHELDEAGVKVLDAETGRAVMREIAPGEPIPGAHEWRNLWREIKAGRVAPEGTPLHGDTYAERQERRLLASRAAARKQVAKRKRTKRKKATRKRATASQSASGPSLPDVMPAHEAAPQTVEREGASEA